LTEPLDLVERRELCDLFVELGPDSPTLCAGWTTLDLAAHLVLREHFQSWGDERRGEMKAQGMPYLVHRLRQGAPPVPWRIPGLRTVLNGVEYFIHHEDVRRANNFEPRDSRPAVEDLAWRMLWLLGRGPARKLQTAGLQLVAGGRRRKRFGSRDGVTLTGAPSEILLYLSGRCAAAEVEVEGSPETIAALVKAVTGS
jgi:uncharacterized protein (TIGR03085 family)